MLDTGTDVVYIYNGHAGHSLGGGSWQCIEERELDDSVWETRRQFIYGGRYIDAPLIFDKDTDCDGDCTDFADEPSGANRYFYAQQVNFNVVAMVKDDQDGTATRVETIQYDPYGAATVTVADGQSATGNPYLGLPLGGRSRSLLLPESVVQPRAGEVCAEGSDGVCGWDGVV